jgi:hypothetical protein
VTAFSVASNNNMQQISIFVNTYLDFLRNKGHPRGTNHFGFPVGDDRGLVE